MFVNKKREHNNTIIKEFNNDLDQRKPTHEYLYKLEETQIFQNQVIQDLRSQILEKTEENQKITENFSSKIKENEEIFTKEIKNFKEENLEFKRISSEIKQKNKILYEENKRFCEEIRYFKSSLAKTEEERRNFDKILQENLEEINFLKKELERSRGIKEEFSQEIDKNIEKIRLCELEIEEFNRKLELISQEKDSIEKIELHDQEIINELEKNNMKLFDENKCQREYLIKLENQLNFMKNQQNKVKIEFLPIKL